MGSDLVAEILALGLFNQHSGFDVDADDIWQYMSETDAPTVQGFKDWLAA